MTMRLAIVLCALGIGTVSSAGEISHVKLADIAPGSRFEFATTDHIYQAELIDPATGEARLAASTDGVHFTAPQTIFLLGATQGRSADAGGLMLVKMNQLQTGMSVELGMGSLEQRDRRLTEPLRSIRVE